MPPFAQFPPEVVRRTQYAGSWYEADPAKLAGELNRYLTQARESIAVSAKHESDVGASGASGATGATGVTPDTQAVLAVIAPHAGYMFSGPTAAFGYEFASKKKVQRVFLLGPSHHVSLHGVALPTATVFETPLGNLEVDAALVAELKTYPLFSVEPEVHRVEHSLEMHLPLIYQTFGAIKIVPLVIGVLEDESEIRLVAEILKGFVNKDDIVVVSSDFTHYGPRYDYCPFHENVRSNIEQLDREAFSHLSKLDVKGFLEFEKRTGNTICGFFPCAVLCAMLPDDAQARLLKYATSQDSYPEDQDNSVSYLSVAFAGSNWPDDPRKRMSADDAIRLSDIEKTDLLKVARHALEAFVRGNSRIDTTTINITPRMKQCFGAFVTLYIRSAHGDSDGQRLLHPNRELRGCIGSIWPVRTLIETVIENAIASASRDYRFTPVHVDELEDIEIEISVLTPPRRVSSYKDIVLGTDGIILSKHDCQAVFLPLVATEFGWDLPEMLRQLSVKAGLRENDWKEGAKFDLFQSISIEESEQQFLSEVLP